MKKFLLINVLILMVSFSSFAQEKATKMVDISAKKVNKTRGTNPNIKTDFVCDAPDVPVAKPAATRGATCTVNVKNWTGYNVKVFVDGKYYGWVSPWDSGAVTVYAGYTTVYIITSGGSYEWSTSGNCDYLFNYTITM